MRTVRDGIAARRRQSLEVAIHRNLEGILDRREVNGVASYSAIHSEVDLAAFHAEWVASGGQLFLPRTLADSRLEFARFFPEKPMKSGQFGILEPIGPAVELDSIDVILVPGLAFDANGGRLGYGAGYYDRFLSRLKRIRTPRATFVGVCFEEQVVADVPMDDHDVPLDWVVSNTSARRVDQTSE